MSVSRPLSVFSLLALLLVFSSSGVSAAASDLSLARQSFSLPGPPAAFLPTDFDGDGRLDLALVVASTTWAEIGIEESTELDGVDGLVEVLTVVPALFDRRELFLFLGQEGGGFALAGEPLELSSEVLSLAAGSPGLPLVVLTDAGLSAVRRGEDGLLALEALVEERPVVAGSGTFLPDLLAMHDLDADGDLDVLVPGAEGLVVYLAEGETLTLASRLTLPLEERIPGDARHYRRGPVRNYPLPTVRDIDGDGLPDLLVANHDRGWNQFQVLPNRGGGRFGAAFSPLGDRDPKAEPGVVYFGDVDGDARAEVVTEEGLEEAGDDAGLREEMAKAKRPRFRYHFHSLDSRQRMQTQPSGRLEVEGYAFGGDDTVPLPGGFQDLDGDGQQDLVTLTLDFSLFDAMKVVTVKRITLDLDFHIWCQREKGVFERVKGLDLSGTFRMNLNDLRLGQLSLFSGDFDGDGRRDFVQLGRGRTVSIHRGRPGCGYPSRPDLSVELLDGSSLR